MCCCISYMCVSDQCNCSTLACKARSARVVCCNLAGCLLIVTDSVWNLFAKRFMTQFSQLAVSTVHMLCQCRENTSM